MFHAIWFYLTFIYCVTKHEIVTIIAVLTHYRNINCDPLFGSVLMQTGGFPVEEWWSRPNQSVSSLIGRDAVVTSSDRSREARACRKGNGSKMIDTTRGLSGALCFHLKFADVLFCVNCLATNLCVIVSNHYCLSKLHYLFCTMCIEKVFNII